MGGRGAVSSHDSGPDGLPIEYGPRVVRLVAARRAWRYCARDGGWEGLLPVTKVTVETDTGARLAWCLSPEVAAALVRELT